MKAHDSVMKAHGSAMASVMKTHGSAMAVQDSVMAILP